MAITLNRSPEQKPEYSTEAIKKAVEIISSECAGAMAFANALGGAQTEEWEIIHNNKKADIVAAARERGLDFTTMKCAVSGTPLLSSAYFQHADGKITDAERHKRFSTEVKKDGKWKETP